MLEDLFVTNTPHGDVEYESVVPLLVLRSHNVNFGDLERNLPKNISEITKKKLFAREMI